MTVGAPTARVEINGRDITNDLFGNRPRLLSLSVSDEAGMSADSCTVEVIDIDNEQPPAVGSKMKVWIGYEPQPVFMGEFEIESWDKKGPVRTMTVSAKGAELSGKIKSAKSRSWPQKTLGEIARAIGGEHGLTVAADSEIASIAIKHVDQQNESDLSFLARLAKRSGAMFKVADGKIILSKRGSNKLPAGGNKPVVVVTPPQSTDWTISAKERGNYKSVTCYYMDHAGGKRKGAKAGSGTPGHRDRRTYASQAEAQAAANAQLGDLNRGKVSLSLEMVGDPSVFAEAMIQLTGFGTFEDGQYLAKTVTHTLDSGGYKTSVSGESYT